MHPVVRAHPETGRRALYLGDRIRTFEGMTEEETRPLADFLNEKHATRYEFTYRHRWDVHDLVMWDNRCTLHRAVADYERGQPRFMLRGFRSWPRSRAASPHDGSRAQRFAAMARERVPGVLEHELSFCTAMFSKIPMAM